MPLAMFVEFFKTVREPCGSPWVLKESLDCEVTRLKLLIKYRLAGFFSKIHGDVYGSQDGDRSTRDYQGTVETPMHLARQGFMIRSMVAGDISSDAFFISVGMY
jgi:hypothetical protein